MAATIAVYTVDYVNATNERRKWRREDTRIYFGPIYEEMPAIISNLKALRPVYLKQWEGIAHSGTGVMVDDDLVKRLQKFRQKLESHVKSSAMLEKQFDAEVLPLLQRALPGVRDIQVAAVSRPIFNGLAGILGKDTDWRIEPALQREFYDGYFEESERGGLTGKMQSVEDFLKSIVGLTQGMLVFDNYVKSSENLANEAVELSEALRSALREASGLR